MVFNTWNSLPNDVVRSESVNVFILNPHQIINFGKTKILFVTTMQKLKEPEAVQEYL